MHIFLIDGTGHNENISVFRVSNMQNTEPFCIIMRGQTCEKFNIASIAAVTVEMNDPR
jgi:hypothetical protein